MSTTLSPYLAFEGTCEEAMNFYADVLGGKVTFMRFGDSPMPVAADAKNRIMHAALKAESLFLMASDGTPDMKIPPGKNVTLSLNFKSADEQTRVWNRLAEGAEISQPLGDMFWGRFGSLTDRYGINWMVNFEPPKATA